MRRRARTDAPHAAIRQALRACGWTVVDTSRVGHGFPDLLAVRGGRVEFVEIKDGTKPPSRQALTPAEARFSEVLSAAGVRIRYVTRIDEAALL